MKTEELQRQVLDSLGGCGWKYDLTCNRIEYSDEFFELLGYRSDELEIDTDWVADSIHPADLSQWHESFVRAVRGVSLYFDCELRFRNKNNNYTWIQTRGVVTERDQQGRALQIIGMVYDISERISAKQSESRYRLFLDNSPDALSLKDREGRYLYINRRFEEWLGKDAYQIYGKTADEIFDPDTRTLDQLREHESQIWDRGETISMERQFPLTSDGVFRHALITKFPVFDESGEILAIGTTNTDVTERFRAQQALLASEQRYRRLFESAPAVLGQADFSDARRLVNRLREQGVDDIKQYLIDHPDLTSKRSDFMQLVDVNQEALRVYRSASKESMIRFLNRPLTEEVRLGLIDDVATFASGETRSSIRAWVACETGEKIPIIRVSELSSADPDDWSQVLVFIRDVSAEEAVRMSELRYRRLFESAPVALYESDWSRGKALIDDLRARGVDDITEYFHNSPELLQRRDEVLQILNLNREALEVYKARSSEQLIASIEGPMTKEQRETVIQVLEIFAAGHRRSSVRSISIRANGEEFPMIRDSELISSDREDWSRVLSSIHDLTAEVETANQLREYQQELRSLAGKISSAEESERRRISSELHDGTIQNLVLARIHLANLRTMLESGKGEQVADSINELLETSLKETRSLIFEISPPVLYELGLEPAVEWLAEHYKQRTGVTVGISGDERSTKLSEEMNIVVFQAARELLVNIAKHAKAKKVSINWRHNDESVVLTVEDDGVGFDTESSRIRLATEGGFGLFAAKERLKLMGADLDIKSSAQGTRVTITAPVESERLALLEPESL